MKRRPTRKLKEVPPSISPHTRASKDAVRILKEFLVRAEAGEIISVTIIAELPSSYHLKASRSFDRIRRIGLVSMALAYLHEEGN